MANNKLTFVNPVFNNSETNFYQKDGLFLHYQAKLIDSPVEGKVNMMTDKDVLLHSKLQDSDSSNSQVLFTNIEGSYISNSILSVSDIKSSPVMNSQVIDSKLLFSSIYDSIARDSVLERSHIRSDSVVNSSVLINSYIKDRSVVDGATIEDCILDGCIVESDVKLSGIIPVPGTYFKHGFWERNPLTVSIPELRYMVTEDVNDRVLIGCQSRPFRFWLNLTLQQVEKLGVEFAAHYSEYQNAVIQIVEARNTQPSPEVLDTKPDDVLYTL